MRVKVKVKGNGEKEVVRVREIMGTKVLERDFGSSVGTKGGGKGFGYQGTRFRCGK